MKPGDPQAGDVTQNPEYAALAQALGSSWEGRVIVPDLKGSAPGAISALSRLGGPSIDGAIPAALEGMKDVEGVGWTVDAADRGLLLKARLRMNEAGRARTRQVFGAGSPPPPGVRAVNRDDAAFFAYFAASPAGALAALAPPGSPLRQRLEPALARAKADLGADIEKDVLPLLSGHAAVAVGVSSLANADPRP